MLALVALVASGAILGLAGLSGCSKEDVSRPDETPTNVVTAYYESPEEFSRAKIKLNGERIDLEWGSQFTADRPYTQVRLSADEGSGDPGVTQYVSVKAVYTDTHLYMLLQWGDVSADQYKDIFQYVGPSFTAPIITCTDGMCDTTARVGPQDSLLTRDWWVQGGEDDKLAVMFEMQEVDGEGGSFASRGCQVACHPGAAIEFGTFERGRLDVWYWLAGRTNPIPNIFNLSDDPEDPSQGTPGYMDDLYANAMAGIVPDEGYPGFQKNFEDGYGYPKWVYRRNDDRLCDVAEGTACFNQFGQICRCNNGLPPTYLWRERPTVYYRPFMARDTLFEGTLPGDPRKWQPGDIVPGYVLTYPQGSRADVRARGGYDNDTHVWTLEVARRLDTRDSDRDVIFEPDAGKDYVFTIAVFDASVRKHWGSEPQILRFGQRTK